MVPSLARQLELSRTTISTQISQKTLAINAMFFLELLVKNASDVVQTLTHQRVRLLPELDSTLRFRDIMR